MILRTKPLPLAPLTELGLHCYYCGQVLTPGAIAYPMAGTAWSHKECRETALASKEAKKAERKGKITLAISKMTLKQQEYYLKPQDFLVKGAETEPEGDFPLF